MKLNQKQCEMMMQVIYDHMYRTVETKNGNIKAKLISQKELANICNVGVANISMLLRGRIPPTMLLATRMYKNGMITKKFLMKLFEMGLPTKQELTRKINGIPK